MTHKRVNKETKEIKATMAEDAEAQPSMRVLTALLRRPVATCGC